MTALISGVGGRSAEGWLALQDHHDLWPKRQQLDLSELHRFEWLPA
jgi:plasmid maintenance system antidote protein VapI